MLGGEGRAAGLLGGRELHEFDTGEVRIVEIELDLAVLSYLTLGAVGAFAVIAGEGGDGVRHTDDAE